MPAPASSDLSVAGPASSPDARLTTSTGRRLLILLGVLVLLTAAVLSGWWAARATLPSQIADVEQRGSAETVWAVASVGSVGRSLPLSTTVRQPVVPVAANALVGVVTSVRPGTVDEGDVVYVVGDTPVRVVSGAEPMWRDLATGARGGDVEVLQRLLVREGHLSGPPDGVFGTGTEAAVRAWQRAQGRTPTGMVGLGELVTVRELPALIHVGEPITVGRPLAGGEDAVLAGTGEREFVLVVSTEQARLIPAEASVEVTHGSHTWEAVIAGSVQDEYSQTVFALTAPDGGPVCGGDCDELPSDEQVTLRSQVVVVPHVSGTTVPAAAVQSRADGATFVTTETGEVEVSVQGSGQGVVVVTGIEPGTRVQALASTGG